MIGLGYITYRTNVVLEMGSSPTYYLAVAPRAFTSTERSGMDRAWVEVFGGGMVPSRRNPAIRSIATGAVGGLKIVAANSPWRTHSWPVRGMPSQPRNGSWRQDCRSS